MKQADLIWMNGEFVAWEDAKVHVLTHALHYGTGVFEGVRAYETARGAAVFRHQDHIDRLFKSAQMYYMDVPFTKEQMGKYKDCIVGTGATTKKDNGYNGLRHWVYVNKGGTMLNWAAETVMDGSVDAPYSVAKLAVKHNCIVYAIQLL